MSETECNELLKRKYRLAIMVGAIAYLVFLKPIVDAIGLQLYIVLFIAFILILSVGQLQQCEITHGRTVLFALTPGFIGITLLLLYAIFFNPTTTMALLSIDAPIANQAQGIANNSFGSLWLLSYDGFISATPATVAWAAYGPVCFASGMMIDAFGDARKDENVQAGGVILMLVPLVIDLTLNLTGNKSGLITDLIPALNMLPQGGMTIFLEMLLNLTPDIVLFSFLAGVVEKSVTKRMG